MIGEEIATDLSTASQQAAENLEKAVAEFLREKGKKIAEAASAAFNGRASKADEDDSDRIRENVEEAVFGTGASYWDWSDLPGKIAADIEESAKSGGVIGIHQMMLTSGDASVRVNAAAADYARERSAELVGMKYVDGELVENPSAQWAITETTREQLRELITDAFEDPITREQLAGKIEGSLLFSEQRAAVIAKTETAMSQANGQYEAWIASGVVKSVKWALSGDHDCCDMCDRNVQAGAVALGEEFPTGDLAPPAHPNCVCTIYVAEVIESNS